MLSATPAHAAALALIHASAFPPPARWNAEAMSLQLAMPGAFGCIDPVGGLVLARVVCDEAEILTLAVAPEARGKGLGGRLLGHAMRLAAFRRATTMVLEVSVANAPACALYRRHGFHQVGSRPRYYPNGEDALILRATLDDGRAPDDRVNACGSARG